MKLLMEMTEEIELLKEENETGGKDYYISGIFLQGNLKNRNGRVYPIDILDKEVKNYTENYINKRRSFGELNHPPNPSINLDRVSHIITELKRDGTNFIGKAKILDTPNGRIVKALMDENCVLGVSSRGLGSLKESNGSKIVQSDFVLTTGADIVSDPSAPGAYVENLIENVDWIFDGASWQKQEVVYDVVKEYKQQTTALREERFLQLWKKLLD